MAVHWAIDLGTSNTTVCEDSSGNPNVLDLDEFSRPEPVTMTPLIPSAVCVLDENCRKVLIGQKALAYNWDGQATGFATSFKRFLGTESQRPLAKIGSRTITARDAAFLFLRELINAIEQRFQTEIDDLTIAVPPSSYETYRAELLWALQRIKQPSNWWQSLLQWLRRRPLTITFRTIDEPVAAALGYGIDIKKDAIVVAFDFGAGSLEVAAVRIEAGKTFETGRAQVLSKQSLKIGGDDVDWWIVEEFVPEPLRALPTYRILLKWEAERVKIAASSGQVATFTFRQHEFGTLDYHKLSDLLAERGLYREVNDVMERLLSELWEIQRLDVGDIDEVILEGGSTLLPEVRNLLADIFGREKVREWAPFESVVRGACLFAAGAPVDDIIYHDYAVRVVSEATETVEYELLIPRGTRYPTPTDFLTRYYAPSQDEQTFIQLQICEVGGVVGKPVQWETRLDGRKVFVPRTEGEHAFCVCLNEGDEAIVLDPPGKGKSPRLRVTFNIDADRWLRMTVHDLLRKVDLKINEPVVKLR